MSKQAHNPGIQFVERERNAPILHLPILMNNEIALLAQFLESLGPEVSGHSAAPLTEDQVEKIQLFASGKLGPAERQALLPSILENETALHTLVKTLEARP